MQHSSRNTFEMKTFIGKNVTVGIQQITFISCFCYCCYFQNRNKNVINCWKLQLQVSVAEFMMLCYTIAKILYHVKQTPSHSHHKNPSTFLPALQCFQSILAQWALLQQVYDYFEIMIPAYKQPLRSILSQVAHNNSKNQESIQSYVKLQVVSFHLLLQNTFH